MTENEIMKMRPVSWIVAAALALGLTPAWAEDTQTMPAMDHSKMNHGTAPSATDATMGGAMGNGSMQGGSPPSDARDPHAYSDGYTLDPARPLMMADEHYFGSLLVNRLEAARTSDRTTGQYDLQARFGRDYDRLVLKAEGDVKDGSSEEARTELLWGHAVSTYWDAQLGVRYDSGVGMDRGWLAFGIQGLAPYWFGVDATAYASDEGHTALRLEAEYELLLTQKLILQPRLESNFYGKRDSERALGSGLSDLVAGFRLRYEILREIAPYVGIEWAGKYGATADYAKAAGGNARDTRIVAGIRFWY